MRQRLLFLLMSTIIGMNLRADLVKVNGYYQINSAADLVEFSSIVNDKNEQGANAVLTADIDLTGINFTPIGMHADGGIREYDWRGKFDGQGHTIRNLTVKRSDTYETGLFGRIIDAEVKNLCIENATISNNKTTRCGVIAAIIIRGQVSNCYTTGNITIETEGPKGGIAGTYLQNFGGSGRPLKCCYTTYPILASESDGIIDNCFAGEEVESMSPTGELCFLLNGDQSVITFYQTIGIDPYPTFDSTHKQVYANGDLLCNGTPAEGGNTTYSNNPPKNLPAHEFDTDGFCVNCGTLQDAILPDEEGWYNVTKPTELRFISHYVNQGHTTIHVRLMNDLDMNEIANFPPIGYFDDYQASTPFQGIFDGQKHVIRNLKVNVGDGQEAGLFGRVNGSGSVRNLGIIDADITNQAAVRAGVLAGELHAVTITNCFTMGTLNVQTEGEQAGGFAGEAADATLVSCFTTTSDPIPGVKEYRNSFYGETVANDGPTGALCYNLNGQTFMGELFWYQTLGKDEMPVWDSTHGIIYSTGDGLYANAITEQDFQQLIGIVISQETEKWSNAKATKATVNEYLNQLKGMRDLSFTEFNEAYQALEPMRRELDDAVQAYEAYIAKADEIRKTLASDKGFAGPDRELLEEYLLENNDIEPNESFPNGSYFHIIDNYTLTAQEVRAETEFMQRLLATAIEMGYLPGADITNLISNADFTDKLNGWNLELGSSTVRNVNNATTNKRVPQTQNSQLDINQTITNVKPGLYEIEMYGYTEITNGTSPYHYTGFLYANDIATFAQTILSDPLNDEDLTKVYSNKRFSEGYDENGEIIGFVPNSYQGAAFAFDIAHYRNRIMVNVTDGTLKLGFRNIGSQKLQNNAILGNARLTYHGTLEEGSAGEALDATLASMKGIAAHLVNDYHCNEDLYAQAPNYYLELKEELAECIGSVTTASSNEEKYALVCRFSSLFQSIYESKQAYEQLMIVNDELADAYGEMGTPAQQVSYEAILNDVRNIFGTGSKATPDVWAMITTMKDDPIYLSYNGIEPQLVDGFYQLTDPYNLVWYSRTVNSGRNTINAMLMNDIDMSAIQNFTPIGLHADGEGAIDITFRGKFDGQGHVIRNLTVTRDDNIEAGLFSRVIDATITNLGIENATVSTTGTVEGHSVRIGVLAAIILRGTTENIYTCGDITLSNGDGEKGYVAGSILTDFSGDQGLAASIFTTYPVLAEAVTGRFTRLYADEEAKDANGNVLVEKADEARRVSGELCYLLNGGEMENPKWFQTLGEDPFPVMDNTHKVVIFENETYSNSLVGIAKVRPERDADSVYDLLGRRVQKVTKGFYIMGNKKILVK